jgi:Tol biopolymer transport system component
VLVAVLFACSGCAYITRANVASNGTPDNGAPQAEPAVSFDGRFVAFSSTGTNLVPGKTNTAECPPPDFGPGCPASDVYVRDNSKGTTERVSIASDGTQGNDHSGNFSPPSISADGRFVAFESLAGNLAAGAPAALRSQIYVRDRLHHTTARVSVDVNGAGAAGSGPSISADGRFVAFHSDAPSLVTGAPPCPCQPNVYVHDLHAHTTKKLSNGVGGTTADSYSLFPKISGDGRFVVYFSNAANLVAGDTNGTGDVFVTNVATGQTERADVSASGAQANNFSSGGHISADGRYVTFWSDASNLIAGDTNGWFDVFVRDRVSHTTTRVSLRSDGSQSTSGAFDKGISGDGRYVAFGSFGGDYVPGTVAGPNQLYVRDVLTGVTVLSSANALGAADRESTGTISGDGRYVAFIQFATRNGGGVFTRYAVTPRFENASPASIARGAAVDVVFRGQEFLPGSRIEAGAGITVGPVAYFSPTVLVARLTVAPTAALGARNVALVAPGTGPGPIAGAFALCGGCVTVT